MRPPTGFVEPGATYRGDAADPSAPPTLFRATKLSVAHDPADYEVKQVGWRCCEVKQVGWGEF